jgi:probable HAF family extracellular repeat protein
MASGVNNQGQIVGSAESAAGETVFLWERGKTRTIPGGYRDAGEINARGQVPLSKSISPSGPWVAWQGGREVAHYKGTERRSVAINDHGVGVGYVEDAVALFRGGPCLNLSRIRRSGPRMHLNAATAINNRGQIVGDGAINGETHAFLLSGVREAQPPRRGK